MADESKTASTPGAVIDEALGAGAVVVFSKSYCPYCKRVKAALGAAGISPVVLELDLRADGPAIQAELARRTGQRTVPSVWLSGKHVGGSDDTIAGLKAGKFDSVDKGAAVAMAEAAGVKKCGAGDGIACLCVGGKC